MQDYSSDSSVQDKGVHIRFISDMNSGYTDMNYENSDRHTVTGSIVIPTPINVDYKYIFDNNFTSYRHDYEMSDTNSNQRWQLEVATLTYIRDISVNGILDG